MKCNIDPEEAKKLIDAAPTYTQEQEWAIAHVFTQYLFVEPLDEQDPFALGYGIKGKRFFCTSCRESFGVSKRHTGPEKELLKKTHGQTVICPRCGERVTLLVKGRYRTGRSLDESRNIVVFRNTEHGLFASAAHAYVTYEGGGYGIEEEPTLIINERAFYLFRLGACAMWKNRGGYWFCGGYEPPRWEMSKNVIEPFAVQPARGYSDGYDGGYYVFGLDELDNSDVRYNAFRDYCGMDLTDGEYIRKLLTYLGEYTGRPQLEMISRLKLFDIVEDLIYRHKTNARTINWKARCPSDLLKLDKAETRVFLKMGGTLDDLREYQQERRAGNPVSLSESLKMTESCGGIENKKTAREFAERHGFELKTLCNYFTRTAEKTKRRNAHVFGMWKDYIDAAQSCGLDLRVQTVAMPKDMIGQHDRITAQARYLSNREKIEAYQKNRLPALRKKYMFEMDGLMIVVPQDDEEIIREGKALRHCVGGYAERHLSGKTDILFLRSTEEPNTPLYTIEMREGKLIQAHGYKNERKDENGYSVPSPFDACGDFLEIWTRWVAQGSPRTPQGKPIVQKTPGKPDKKSEGAA